MVRHALEEEISSLFIPLRYFNISILTVQVFSINLLSSGWNHSLCVDSRVSSSGGAQERHLKLQRKDCSFFSSLQPHILLEFNYHVIKTSQRS